MASVFAHLVPCECEPEVCDIPVIVFDIGHVLVQLGVKGGKLVHIRIISCRLIRTRHLKIYTLKMSMRIAIGPLKGAIGILHSPVSVIK